MSWVGYDENLHWYLEEAQWMACPHNHLYLFHDNCLCLDRSISFVIYDFQYFIRPPYFGHFVGVYIFETFPNENCT